MGAIFYLVMDIIIHWGVLRRMREEVDANPVILVSAIILDAVALIAFIVMKALVGLGWANRFAHRFVGYPRLSP